MLKKTMLLGASCLTFLAVTSPQEVDAMPVYARQTGQSCSACHFQRFPLLNNPGRTFKVNGYTQVGKQGTIEDTNLSLPATLNATVLTKFRYQKRNGTATSGDAGELNSGQFQVPDEATLYLGGKAAKNIGFQAEIGFTRDTAGLIGFKVPFVFPASKDVTLSAIPFFTDAQGAAYGFELLNTGALRFSRAFEHRKETSAQQYIGTAEKSTGVALVAHHKYGYVSYTPYIREDAATFSSGQFLNYFRGVVTPEKVGDFDLAAGVQIWTGDSKTGTDNPVLEHGSAWSVDAQAQGKVGNLPLGVYVTYGSAAKSVVGNEKNVYNLQTADDKKAFTVATELGIIPSRLSLGLGYRNANTGAGGSDADNAVTFGANYQIAKNMILQVNHSIYSGDVTSAADGDNQTTIMLYSAF